MSDTRGSSTGVDDSVTDSRSSLYSAFYRTPVLPRPDELKLLRMWELLLDDFDTDAKAWPASGGTTSILYVDDKKRHNFVVKTHNPHFNRGSGELDASLRSTFWDVVIRNDHPDVVLRRCLLQQKGDVHKAIERSKIAIRWRNTTSGIPELMGLGEEGFLKVLQNSTTKDEDRRVAQGFITQLEKGLIYFRGQDRLGRSISWGRFHAHRKNNQPFRSMTQYILWTVETARLVINPGLEGAVQVLDFTGMTMHSMDLFLLRWFVDVMREQYPLGISLVIVHGVPRIFEGVWAVVRQMISEDGAKRIRFTRSLAELESYIDRSQIPQDMGGDDTFSYTYPPPVPGENDIMKDTFRRDQLLRERAHLAMQFEACTRVWIKASRCGDPGLDEICRQRDFLSDQLRRHYWKLDPYIRARCYYDRWNVIGPPSALASPASSTIDVRSPARHPSLDAATQTDKWLQHRSVNGDPMNLD